VYYPSLKRTLGEALLEPHRSYYRDLVPVLSALKGIAHITGGGIIGNVARILPKGLAVTSTAIPGDPADLRPDSEAGQRRDPGDVPGFQHGPGHGARL